jgi:hypothetical protein
MKNRKEEHQGEQTFSGSRMAELRYIHVHLHVIYTGVNLLK